jgi:sodium transport system permease protein
MSATATVFFKELRESLRDRRVLINTFLIGPFLGPVLFALLINLIVGRELHQAERALPVVVIGAEHAPNLVAALRQAGLAPLPAIADPEAAVREQRAELVLRIPPSFAADWSRGNSAQLELIYDSSRREGGAQIQRLKSIINGYVQRTGAMRLMARGLSPALASPVLIAERDQATPQSRGALLFAMLPYMLVFAAFFGGMFLAIDATAGERERQSLEPLLINPVPRWQILLGKVLATSAFSLASVCLSLAAFALAGRWLPTERLGMTIELGWRFVTVVLPVMLPLVLMLSVLQTLVAAFARSFREAQTQLSLLQLLPMIPSMLLVVMPFRTQLWMFALPILGQQLTIMRALRGELVTAPQLWLCAAATLLAAALAFAIARRIYDSERMAISA